MKFFRILALGLGLSISANAAWADTAAILQDSPQSSLTSIQTGTSNGKMSFRHKNRTRTGIASWYSETDANINTHTANGEIFDDSKMTCASWDYSFGTKLEITNVSNGKSVICRVNDRGPSKRLRRLVDLSKGAFKKIESPRKGLILVKLRVVQPPSPTLLRAIAEKNLRFS